VASLWRVVNAGFSVELAADLGAAGARPTGRRPGPQPAAWSGPLPGPVGSCLRWQRPAAAESADPGRPARQAVPGPAGTRSAESADRLRSNRSARGRIGPAHAVESACRLLNRPAGGAVGRSTRAAFPRPKGRGVAAKPPRVPIPCFSAAGRTVGEHRMWSTVHNRVTQVRHGMVVH
jgi:hypothetical protein